MSTETANGMQMMFDLSTLEICQQPIVIASAHHVRTSALQEIAKDLTETDQALSLKYFALWKNKQIDPNGLSMKTLKECFQAIADGITSGLSLKWTDSGTMSNGSFSTQKISACRKTGKEYTLSDILEDTVDEKYYLSEAQVKKILWESD